MSSTEDFVSVNQIKYLLDTIDGRIRKFPAVVQVCLYFGGFILVLAGSLPGTDFGQFKIPELNAFARICAGLIGAPLISGFFLLLLKDFVSRVVITVAVIIGLIFFALVIWSPFKPIRTDNDTKPDSEVPTSMRWLLVSRPHRALMSNSRMNHPDEYDHVNDLIKHYMNPARAADLFRDHLEEYTSIALMDETNISKSFMFVTADRYGGDIVFDLLSRDLKSTSALRLRVTVGMIAFRRTSVSPILVTTCVEVPCSLSTNAIQAAVFVFPLDDWSRTIVTGIVDDGYH